MGNNHNATLNNGVLINQPGIYETSYSFDEVGIIFMSLTLILLIRCLYKI